MHETEKSLFESTFEVLRSVPIYNFDGEAVELGWSSIRVVLASSIHSCAGDFPSPRNCANICYE